MKEMRARILFLLPAIILLLSTNAFASAIMISGAMDVETEIMIAALDNRREHKIGVWRFVSGEYKGCPLIISVTEIGCGNAAASTALGIEHFQPLAVINQGTAGAHHRNIHKRDIVLGASTLDIGARKVGGDNALLGNRVYDASSGAFVDKIDFPADEKLLEIAREVGRSYTHGKIHEGKILTSNAWHCKKSVIKHLNKQFGSLCEEMETNVAAQICCDYNVPFLGVRIISNNELTNEEYDRNIGELCQEFALEIARRYYREAA